MLHYRDRSVAVAVTIAALILLAILSLPLLTGRVCAKRSRFPVPADSRLLCRLPGPGRALRLDAPALRRALPRRRRRAGTLSPVAPAHVPLAAAEGRIPGGGDSAGMAHADRHDLVLAAVHRTRRSLAGALFFTFSVKFIWHLDIPTYGLIMAHIPWLLGAVDAALSTSSSRRRRWAGAAIALLLGSAICAGSPRCSGS